MRDLASKFVKLPQRQKIGTLAWRYITILPAIRRCLVAQGTHYEGEKIGNGKEPLFLHFVSVSRFVQYFTVDDVQFGRYVKKGGQDELTYYFSSLCILERASGPTIKAYGWTETPTTVTFIYRTSRTTTALITFPRPTFETIIVRRETDGKSCKKRSYVCDTNFVDGLRMQTYTPICMYLSAKRRQNFELLAARLCVTTNSDGNIMIVKTKTS